VVNIRRIYKLPNVEDKELWPLAEWCDHDVFFDFVGNEIDDERFNYKDAREDERVKIELKAYAELAGVHSPHYVANLEYIAFSFDGSYVGLAIAVDRPFGYDVEAMYITDYPKFQAMVAYVKTMYQLPHSHIIGETTKIEDLDGRYGTVIDKRYKWNTRTNDTK
jgi:hypothetical protein